MYDNLYLHGFEDSEAVSGGGFSFRSCVCVFERVFVDGGGSAVVHTQTQGLL